jgi:hypothetical protein
VAARALAIWLSVDMALAHSRTLRLRYQLMAQIDLRFRFENYQRAAWPLAAWIEKKCNGLTFTMRLPCLL